MDITKLGRFEIIEEIGAGGMGLVYKGRDPKINRMVALKVVRPTFGATKLSEAQKEAADRFYVEAQAAGQLSHPNIVTIYDVGEEETKSGAMVYIAMEFLEGKELEWHIRNDTYDTLEKKIGIVRQMAEGLHYAHQRNVIHRDVKPANIIVTGGDIPKITDFGLARLADSSLTMSGTVLGTPNYMAPEQVKGDKVDARSDLFSLTVVFYEMLTGQKPFGAESITSVIYKVVNDDPVSPSELANDLPESVDVFVKKGMAKKSDQRFQNGVEFIEGLDAILGGDGFTDLDMLGDTTRAMSADQVAEAIRESSGHISTRTPPKTALPDIGGLAGLNQKTVIGGIVGLVALLLILVFSFSGSDEEELVANALEEKLAVTSVPTVSPTEKESFITITSKPADAEVFIDGGYVGATPLTKMKVAHGEHELKLTRKGYKEESRNISVTKDESVEVALVALVKATPKPKPVAKPALVISAPRGSTITLDGKTYEKNRVTLRKLRTGSHMIYIQKKSGKPYIERFRYSAGQTKTITVP